MHALTLGRFVLDDVGRLGPRAAVPPTLRFAWRGRPCEAVVTAGALHLGAKAGRIPATAARPGDRRGALAALAALRSRTDPDGLRAHLQPDHTIRIARTARLAHPTTAVALIAELARFAVALSPYLDALEAAGVVAVPGAAASGTANT